MKQKVSEKTLRLDEILNGFIARKIAWTEQDSGRYLLLMTIESGEVCKYVINKNDGYLTSIQKQKVK